MEPGDRNPADGSISIDDGTWVDVGRRGRWQPTIGERVRSVALLTVLFVFLGGAALVASVDDGDDGDDGGGEESVSADTSTTTTTAPTTTTTAPPDPASVGGAPPPPPCEGDDRQAAPLRERGEVVVLVLNGTGRGGYAGSTTDALEDAGYQSASPDNATRTDTSIIGYKPGFCAEGVRLAGEDLGIPTASVEPMPRNLPVTVGRAEIVVILGADSL